MAAESARSPVTASASSSVARLFSSELRANKASRYPRCARRRAQAAPMPLLAAVTIATGAEGMDGNVEFRASNGLELSHRWRERALLHSQRSSLNTQLSQHNGQWVRPRALVGLATAY